MFDFHGTAEGDSPENTGSPIAQQKPLGLSYKFPSLASQIPLPPFRAFLSVTAHKPGQLAVIALVRGAQGIQIGRPDFPLRHSAHAAPGKRGPAQKLFQQQVGGQSRVATIPVRERVDPHQPMMEPAGDFIRGIRFVFDLRPGVRAQLVQLDADVRLRHADILVAGAKFPRPFPDPAKHLAMQLADESFVQNGSGPGRIQPLHGLDDIFLLQTIEFFPGSDVSGNQSFRFIRVQGRGAGRLRFVHALSPKIFSVSCPARTRRRFPWLWLLHLLPTPDLPAPWYARRAPCPA